MPPEPLLWVLSFVGFAGLVAVGRVARAKYRRARKKVVEAWGDLFGREAVRHPNTDEIILPATQGIGTRLTTIERWQSSATISLQQIAETQAELLRIHTRIDEEAEQRELLQRQFEQHLDDEVTTRRREVEMRAETERAMWTAIEAVAVSAPPETGSSNV